MEVLKYFNVLFMSTSGFFMKKSSFVILILTLLSSFGAKAGGWTGFQQIESIIIEGNAEGTKSWAMIGLVGGVAPALLPGGCNGGGIVVYLDSEKGRAMLSTALSARMADKPIRVALSGCAAETIADRAVIGNMWL